jgi:hypothetical protein
MAVDFDPGVAWETSLCYLYLIVVLLFVLRFVVLRTALNLRFICYMVTM